MTCPDGTVVPQAPPLALPSRGSQEPGKANSPTREPVLPCRESGGEMQACNDARLERSPWNEDGGLNENTGDVVITGALCYRDPYPPTATESGGDNYGNGDERSLSELGKDYNGLINAIEEELCAVEGLEGMQSQAKKGRSTGARFCWKPTMGDDAAGAARTTSV